MDFSITEEQQMMVETATKIGEQFGLDYWRKLDEAGEYPTEMWQAICDAGFCGVALAEEHGGVGLGMLEMALIVEALCKGGAGSTLSQLFMLNPIFGGVSISKYGSDEMRRTVLPRIISGEIGCCMALTEPDAGTNSLEVRTFAEADGNGWRLNGQKIWISAVPQAEKMLVIARTKKKEGATRKTDGITLFMIDVAREGVSHQAIDKVGTRCVPASNVFFDNAPVHGDELVGTLHGGWKELLDVLNTERIVTTAGLVGAVHLALRLAVDYANQRKVFGERTISSYQGLQFPLAQAHAEIECARAMNHKAAAMFDAGEDFGSEANIAKLIAAQAAAEGIERAMQTMGGMGYAKEMHVERLWRDARLFRFAPISEEMILNYISIHELGMARGY
ncbi:MAG: acyl-CoA/acyl-ACP dehydrogenase [Rhodospirillaceae bacterium]|nr:acyl-CoA/acyl-ACP dehydrogenase [Rhodospirillaceae bacterium]MBT3926931.1 acyl-CoA/acyl-ACP dehydrogenase [Rhodospirillaceae bacterium]MBT5037162.1 acyl-CoA/acyl-ACP dehydrogenase [Rhodospirillaceae bacterium]MBT5676048.1 acyl-CoA/acyl-ACP dehydrogenase [Rhodospirillaceae bacterium]MBT5778901.1 acyl-CoA/acyl-ACP dehydrogenase [Rhodospirillaceae bacterium]